jgi:hypothetical protein
MSKTFATYFAERDFNPAFIADNASIAGFFVFPAITFPIPHRAEDSLAEKPIFLRLQGSIVYRLRFLNLPVRPAHNSFRRSEFYTY